MSDAQQHYNHLVDLSQPLFDLTNDNDQFVLRDKKMSHVTEIVNFLFHDVLNSSADANASLLNSSADSNASLLNKKEIKVDKKQEQAWHYFNSVLIQVASNATHNDMKMIEDRFSAATINVSLLTQSIWDMPIFDESKKEIQNEIFRARYKPQGINGIGKCKRCGSEELHAHEKQLRSADEPMSTIFKCLMCANEWREG